MENYQGDLTDIIRATGTVSSDGGEAVSLESASASTWQFPSTSVNFCEDFGDPFIHLRDPLRHDIKTPNVSKFFHASTSSFEQAGDDAVLTNEVLKRPPNVIFSRMLQISPSSKLPQPPAPPPLPRNPPAVVPSPILISPNTAKGSCLLDCPGGLQISSPRNAGIRRRKSQVKKVVCIPAPAPAPANTRPSGEIVPSDLWAWRKYGQKPIKGSPYPRGYYRCSSSKGCLARKQVERSRTDPNMLVITYTSEHNHPWPTQRNALAGSTRSQPSKNATKNSQSSPSQRPKEEQKVINHENATTAVKQETNHQDFDPESENGFPNTYKPTLPDSNHSEDNFFADLGEIDTDSLDILFAQGFSRDGGILNKDLDPFNFYDCGSNNATYSSGGEAYVEDTIES